MAEVKNLSAAHPKRAQALIMNVCVEIGTEIEDKGIHPNPQFQSQSQH